MIKANTICSFCGRLKKTYTKCICKSNKPQRELDRNKELTTTKWRKFRKEILIRDKGHCQRCLKKFGILNTNYNEMQVHHIKPRINYPELMYDETNCVTLCALCNQELGIRDTLDFEHEAQPLKIEYHL